MRFRLSLLMFLQYAIPGAWVPLFSPRLTEPAAGSATALVFFLTGFTEGEESTPAACPEPADSLVPAQRMT